MSLLVFNSTARVAQGLVRHLYKAGTFQKIVCADVYPNYWGIQRHLNFRESLKSIESKTQISDEHIQEVSDLRAAVSRASHVVYVTHDYYRNCPSKLNLIVQTAKLVKQLGKIEKFVTVTPVELDHYGENDPIQAAVKSENDAKNIFPDVIQVKSDLTFGPDADVVTKLLERMANGKGINFKPLGSSLAPIFVPDLAQIVEKLLASGEKGARFFAQGPAKIDWHSIISVLEGAIGSSNKAQLNTCMVEKLISPQSNNLFSELYFHECYLNLVQFIAQYHNAKAYDFKDVSEFGIKLTGFQEFYKANPVKASELKWKGCTTQCLLY